MSDVDAIKNIRDQTVARIQEVTAEKKPNYYVGSERYDWASYLKTLQETLDWCDRKLRDYGQDRVHEESGIILL